MINKHFVSQNCQYTAINKNIHSLISPNITVILAVYNEEVSIGSIILKTKKYSCKVVVVDAVGSNHITDVAELVDAEVIRKNENKGKVISLKQMIETALDSDIIVIMNLAVCRDPELIPRMIAPIKNGTFDLSIGACFSKLKKSSEYGLLLNEINTDFKPIGYIAFSKECLSKIDFSQICLNSISPIIDLAEKKGIKVQNISIQEEHKASLFRAYKIGVVVPAYNEERCILETIDGIPDYVNKIYAINDASSDKTAEIINSTVNPRVVKIHNEANKGIGASIIDGYKHSLADEMDLVVVMTGGNEMDPDQLPKLIMPIIKGKADYTKGKNLLSKEILKGMPKWFIFSNAILSMITKISSGYWNISDPQNGYTVVSRQALETIDLDSIYAFYGYCNDLLIKMNAFGIRVVDVTIPARYSRETYAIHNPSIYIRNIAPVVFRGFFWRLKRKYIPNLTDTIN